MTDQPVLQIQGLCMSFGATDVLRNISLYLTQGERLALIGPNGAGKSTLFNLLSGCLRPSSGNILFRGQRIAGMRPQAIFQLGMARSFQISQLFPRLTVFDNLRCGVMSAQHCKPSDRRFLSGKMGVSEQIEHWLTELDLSHRRDVLAMELSYAEQRALEIGITVAGGCELLLLDEPTSGMSRSESDRFVELLRRVTQGKTLMMVEHDMGVVFGLADRVAVLVQGELLICDRPEVVRSDPRVKLAYLGTKSFIEGLQDAVVSGNARVDSC